MLASKRDGILQNIALCNLRGVPAIRPKGHRISFLFAVVMVGDTIRSIVHGAYRTLLILSQVLPTECTENSVFLAMAQL